MKIKKTVMSRMVLLLGAIFGYQVLFATNDVIIFIDIERSETIANNRRALAIKLLLGLYEKAAPIIVSSHILELVVSWQQRMGDKNLKQLRNFMQTSSDPAEMQKLVDELMKPLIDPQFLNAWDSGSMPLLSLVDFDKNNWNCYLHNSANLTLLIPKQYIQHNVPLAINSNPKDQSQACGFNPAVTTVIEDLSPNSLLQKLQLQQAAPIQEEKFVANLTSLFIPDNTKSKWAIYLVGHGGPVQTLHDIRGELERAKKGLAYGKKELAKDPTDLFAKEIISHNQSKVRKYEKILAKYKTGVVPETATIAGLDLNDFKRLLRFFDKHMDTAFLHYSTCYGGGYNQALVNKELKKLKVDFIVSAEGLDETYTIGFSLSFVPNSTGRGLILAQQLSFSRFFKLLKLYIDKPEGFEERKNKGEDPLAEILRCVVPEMQIRNQPFVRLPDAGTFEVLALSKKVKSLTKSIVKEYESKKQPIDLSKDSDIEVIIDYPPRLNVPLNLGSINRQDIVSPTPKRTSSSFEIIHVFKEIHAQQTIQSFMFHLIHFNARLNKQTFVVNKLTGILCEKSGLPVGKENVIRNLIVQIKGVLGNLQESEGIEGYATPENVEPNVMGANVEVAFELNNVIYQSYFTLPNFTDYTVESFQSFSFTGTPVAKADWKGFAEIFIPAEKVKGIPKPITMDAIVKYISDRIDKQ